MAVSAVDRRPRTRARRVGVLAVLAALLVVVAVASLVLGSRPLPLATVWAALSAPTGSDTDFIVWSLRVPRTILGVGVGVALGVGGALMQGHTRNPLADPGLLGVSAGAALLVVVGVYALGVTALLGYVWFAFAGAFGASVLVFLLGTLSPDGPTPVTLALAGVAVSAFLGSITTTLILGDRQTLDVFRFWSVGSLAERGGDVVAAITPFLAVGLVLALVNAPGLNLLGLGEDVARGLGAHVARIRVTGLVAITLLVGGATAACGPITFVGLVVPHVCRHLTGPDHRWLLPASGLAGAVLLLGADIVGRLVAWPGELQVGIVLAVVGAPFFVLLVRRKRLASL